MRKLLLDDIQVTIPEALKVGDKLYQMKPVITATFVFPSTANDVKKGVRRVATGSWICSTKSAYNSVRNITGIDLYTALEDKFIQAGIEYTPEVIESLAKRKFQDWCLVMTVECNRKRFLEKYKGRLFEVSMKQTTNTTKDNLLPQVYKIIGYADIDPWLGVLDDVIPSKFTLNKKR